MLLVIPAYLGFRLAHDGYPNGARWVAAGAVLLPALTAAWFVLRLSRPLRAFIWMIVTTGRQRRAGALAGVAAVLLVVAMLVPPPGWVQWFLGAAALAGLLVRVTTTAESNDHARAAGIEVADYPTSRSLVFIAVGVGFIGVLALVAALGSGGQPSYLVGAAVLFGLAGWAAYTVVKRNR